MFDIAEDGSRIEWLFALSEMNISLETFIVSKNLAAVENVTTDVFIEAGLTAYLDNVGSEKKPRYVAPDPLQEEVIDSLAWGDMNDKLSEDEFASMVRDSAMKHAAWAKELYDEMGDDVTDVRYP